MGKASGTNGAVAEPQAKRPRGEDPEIARFVAAALTHDELARRLRMMADGTRRFGVAKEVYLLEAAHRLEAAREAQLVAHAQEMQAMGEELS